MRDYYFFYAATLFADNAVDTAFIGFTEDDANVLAKNRYDQFIASGYTPDRLRVDVNHFYFKMSKENMFLLWYAGGRALILKFLEGQKTGFYGDQDVSDLLAIDKSPRRKEKRRFKLVPIGK